jgi:hypothetical protein
MLSTLSWQVAALLNYCELSVCQDDNEYRPAESSLSSRQLSRFRALSTRTTPLSMSSPFIHSGQASIPLLSLLLTTEILAVASAAIRQGV